VACVATFVSPANNIVLSDLDDLGSDHCETGFEYDIAVATSAPDGTAAELIVNGLRAATTTVTAAVAKFSKASLGNAGVKKLVVNVGSGASACVTSEQTITIDCLGVPTCVIATPTFDASVRAALNGVPVSSGGDRVSSNGSPYQAKFAVNTNVENGQSVALSVDGTTVYGVASGGVAKFDGVTLLPDGPHEIGATCASRSGRQGIATPVSVKVDTAAPVLAVTKWNNTGVPATEYTPLADGSHFSIDDDADPLTAGLQVKLCGETTSEDATNVGATFPASANNFCVTIGGNAPICGPVTAIGTRSCVNWTCSDGAVDVSLSLKDAAQNITSFVRSNVTCAATIPTLVFADPVSDSAPFSDVSKRILVSDSTVSANRDKNKDVAGAQYDVKLCSTATAGSNATLKVGRAGETLNQIATATVVIDEGGTVCKGQYPNAIKFPDVTLPESLTDSTFRLSKATELSVTVTDSFNKGVNTQNSLVWIDSTRPSLTLNSPAGICNSFISATTEVSRDLTFGTPIASKANPVTLVVESTNGTTSGSSVYYGETLSFSQTTISGVKLPVGTNTLTASVTEPSGNSGQLANACVVNVTSNPPHQVTWTGPTAANYLVANATSGANLLPDGNTDGTDGWQGNLTVSVASTTALAGVTVQFAANGTPIGAPVPVTSITTTSTGESGTATLTGATVPAGAFVALTATTSAGASASGTGAISIPVDPLAPSTPTALVATVTDRRATTFGLSWLAAADGAGKASGYQVRVSKSPIATDAAFTAATDIPYAGVPGAAGETDSVDAPNLRIENDYYFAVRAVDAVGNRSAIASTSAPSRATFNVINLASLETVPSGQQQLRFGGSILGTADINGDGYSDVLVGHTNGTAVYVYFGSATAIATTPATIIRMSVAQASLGLANIGDVNGDGFTDVAIGSPGDGAGKAFVFYGRSTWPVSLTEDDADVSLLPDASVDTKFSASGFGLGLAGIGDFNRDGVDDFAIGAPLYDARKGHLTIVYGKKGGLTPAITFPSAYGSAATQILGDTTTASRFGQTMTGVGRFYGTAYGTAMVVSAYAYGSNRGRLYVFRGSSGTPVSLAISTAVQVVDGPVAASYVGQSGPNLLGDVGPSGRPAVGLGMPNVNRAEIRSGLSTEGPLSQILGLTTQDTPSSNQFGRIVFGGGISGTTNTFSFIGGSRADVVVSTLAGTGGPRLFIVDGDKLIYGGADVKVETLADVTYPCAGWTDFGRVITGLRDINGDGYGDIAFGEIEYSNTPIAGRVRVLY
jgi:hypothetical protein